jgi:asparagine synthase (glutamine-hydrolysing)
MDGLMPYEVNYRKSKIGFNSPVAQLLKNVLKEWVHETIEFNNKYKILNSELLKKEYIDVIKSEDWSKALEFWKKISALRLIYIFQKKGSS